MVLLEIDAAGLAVFKFERDAPRSIDVDGITLGTEPLQGMKVEARDVHFLGSDGDVETIESCKNALVHLRIYFRAAALRPQLRKRLALEAARS